MSAPRAYNGPAPSGAPGPLPLPFAPRSGEVVSGDGKAKEEFKDGSPSWGIGKDLPAAAATPTSDPTPTFSTKPNFGVTHQPYGTGETLGEEIDLPPLSVSMIGEGYSRWAYPPQS